MTEQMADAWHIRMSGALDLGTTAHARQQLMPIATAADRPLLLDLSEVSVLTAAGARLIYDLHVALTAQSQALALHAPARPVAGILALTGLSRLLMVQPGTEAAAPVAAA